MSDLCNRVCLMGPAQHPDFYRYPYRCRRAKNHDGYCNHVGDYDPLGQLERFKDESAAVVLRHTEALKRLAEIDPF